MRKQRSCIAVRLLCELNRAYEVLGDVSKEGKLTDGQVLAG
jgi:hypothetical protein